MAKKQFKAESKRLMDLMINSIYTHREIFLREIISNASDAIDKLAYAALTDEKVGLSREDFAITITRDEANRTITVSDNGIGIYIGAWLSSVDGGRDRCFGVILNRCCHRCAHFPKWTLC